MTIRGRTALVTGGGSGIGLAPAARLAADGAHVAICGRTEDKLAKAEAAIAPSVGDGVDPVDRRRCHDRGAGGGGRRVCRGTGRRARHPVRQRRRIPSPRPVRRRDLDDVRTTIDLNLVGTIICIKHAVPAMRDRGGGSIIGMSSGAGHFPHRWLWAYGASKAGVEEVCRCAAEEFGGDGIRANVLQPGIIDDELMAPITGGGSCSTITSPTCPSAGSAR